MKASEGGANEFLEVSVWKSYSETVGPPLRFIALQRNTFSYTGNGFSSTAVVKCVVLVYIQYVIVSSLFCVNRFQRSRGTRATYRILAKPHRIIRNSTCLRI